MSVRTPVTTIEELNAMDNAEIVEGYGDGFSGDAEPGDNRSKAYWHGWRNGRNDRAGVSEPDQIVLARALYRPSGS